MCAGHLLLTCLEKRDFLPDPCTKKPRKQNIINVCWGGHREVLLNFFQISGIFSQKSEERKGEEMVGWRDQRAWVRGGSNLPDTRWLHTKNRGAIDLSRGLIHTKGKQRSGCMGKELSKTLKWPHACTSPVLIRTKGSMEFLSVFLSLREQAVIIVHLLWCIRCVASRG